MSEVIEPYFSLFSSHLGLMTALVWFLLLSRTYAAPPEIPVEVYTFWAHDSCYKGGDHSQGTLLEPVAKALAEAQRTSSRTAQRILDITSAGVPPSPDRTADWSSHKIYASRFMVDMTDGNVRTRVYSKYAERVKV